MSVDWNGRTFGQLTPEEKRVALAEAAAQMQSELTALAPAIAAVLADDEAAPATSTTGRQ